MTTLAQVLEDKKMTAAELARRIGRSKSHLSHVLANRKVLSRNTALAIYRETGAKLGPLVALSDADIRVLARIEAKAA